MTPGYRLAARVWSKHRLGPGEVSHSEPSISLIGRPNGLYCVVDLNGQDFDKFVHGNRYTLEELHVVVCRINRFSHRSYTQMQVAGAKKVSRGWRIVVYSWRGGVHAALAKTQERHGWLFPCPL